jgi:hypothetical protein
MARPISKAEAVRRRQESAKAQDKARKIKRAVLAVGGTLAGVGLILLIVFCGTLVGVVRHQRLQASAEQFLAYGGKKGPEGEPHLRGKLVLMDRRAGTLDPTQAALPDEIRAYSADEVGTVGWLEWDFVETQSDRGGVSGHYSQCKVTLVDRESNQIIAEQTVTGASSPVSKGSRYVPPGQRTANRCVPQVVAYLQGLPRR